MGQASSTLHNSLTSLVEMALGRQGSQPTTSQGFIYKNMFRKEVLGIVRHTKFGRCGLLLLSECQGVVTEAYITPPYEKEVMVASCSWIFLDVLQGYFCPAFSSTLYVTRHHPLPSSL